MASRQDGGKGPVPPLALEAIGALDIDSTTQATARSYMPLMTLAATKCIACCDDPHWRSTVVAGTVQGSPPATTALRATLQPCSPVWVTQPQTTSSMRSGSTPFLSTIDFKVKPSRSAGCHPDRAPFRFPKAVLTTSTMTASRPDISSSSHQGVDRREARVDVVG